MASASENVEVKSSPKKIIEKTVIDAVEEEIGKQDECVTNGKTKSPQKSHAAVVEDGNQLEDARSPQETEVVEEEQTAAVAEDEAETTAVAAGGDAETNGEATEVIETATAAAESNDVAAPKTSPTKSVSPLKKKAEAGDTVDEPDVKKARRSLEQKAEAEIKNGTTADVADETNGEAVEAAT